MTRKLLLALLCLPALSWASYQPITGSTVTVANPNGIPLSVAISGSSNTVQIAGTVPVSVATPYTVILTTAGANASTTTVVVSGTPNVSVTNTPAVSQSGTWTVQVGNTQNTTPIQVISTNTVLGTGTNSIGTVQIGNTQNTTPIQVTSTNTLVQGMAATGAAASGNPLLNGVLASSNTVTYQTDTG